MSDFIFRFAIEHDLASVQRYVDELYISYPGEEGMHPDIRLTFEEFSRHPDKGVIVVFEMDRRILGYAIIVFFWSNEFAGDVIEVDELFIEQEYRGRGAGKHFFAWLETTYPDCVALDVQVSEKNGRAIRLYESAGFKQSRNTYLLKLLSGRVGTIAND